MPVRPPQITPEGKAGSASERKWPSERAWMLAVEYSYP